MRPLRESASVALFLLATLSVASDSVATPQEDLQLLISLEQLAIPAPFPARATLHMHNAGKETLWLYRRVRNGTKEGSSLEVRLEPLDLTEPQAAVTPARGNVLESAGLPRPRLVKLAPDGDTTEKVTLRLLAARTGEGEGTPIWGRYRLMAVYSARFSNAAEMARETNARLWQGETSSNRIEVELQPPTGNGVVTGSVVNAQGQPLRDVIVTLSDESEKPVDQMATESEGRFAFTSLPPGKYWVTVRRAGSNEDTTVFRHVVLTANEPTGSIDFVLYPTDIYEPRGILHKPVIMLVTDGQENPQDRVSFEVVWSSGKVLDTSRGETDRDGTAALELIPGRNFVTLKRKGCPKQEHRMDVTPGGGVDGFKLAFECAKK
jgi:hypothetical protein